METDYTKIESVNPAGTDVGATDDDLATDFSIFDLPGADPEEDALSLLRPANVGLGRGSGFKSIEQLKAEIAAAEGTADDGGYDRLLGYQEDNFNVVPSEMTVQQVLDFQLKRGEGSYADYSKGVNLKNNQLREDGTPKISTPVGKYQVVGSTLGQLIKDGIVDPNDKFDATTQEKIGEYLINEKRGYNRAKGPDVLDGGITQAEFEKGLGQEFQGIQKDKTFSLSGGSVMNAEDLKAKVASGGSLTPEEFDFMVKDTSAITSKIEPEFGLAFGDGDDDEDNTGINQPVSSIETVEAVIPGASDDEIAKIKAQLDASVPVQGFGKFISNIGKGLFYGLGENFVQSLIDKTEAERTDVVNMHMNAINNGATPKYDDDGKYIGYDMDTMSSEEIDATFGTGNIFTERTPGASTIDFGNAANENMFTTSDGEEYAITPDGKAVLIKDGVVGTGESILNSGLGTGTEITEVPGLPTEITEEEPIVITEEEPTDTTTTETETPGDEIVDTGYTTDESGNKICNQAGYIYSVATDACVPAAELGNNSLNIGSIRSFDNILKGIQTTAPTIAPISDNIKPFAQGGMAGLNQTADNFLRALGG